MTEARSLLQEINETILQGSPDSCARALWHATDLLIAGRYTEDQIWTFGEVIGRLADEIELTARAELAKRLAHTDKAPINVVKKLAFDDSIDVAGPVLRHSERIDTKTLVANARTKSQAHLLAIANRSFVPDRGDRRTCDARQSGGSTLGCGKRWRSHLGFRLLAHDYAVRGRFRSSSNSSVFGRKFRDICSIS